MGIVVDGVQPPRVESAGPPNQAVHLVALPQKQFRQVRTILPGDAGDQSLFRHILFAPASGTSTAKASPERRSSAPKAVALLHIHLEENHRWTQMDTDSEGWTLVSLAVPAAHCPARGLTPGKSAVLSSFYLCLSVSICGCPALLGPMLGPSLPPVPEMEPVVGFEPTTRSLQNCCSTTELNWPLHLIPLGLMLMFAVDFPTHVQHTSNMFGGLSAAPDPMKTIRKDWPRVRQYVKAGSTYFHVDLRLKHYQGQKFKNFTSRDKALEFASEIGKKVAMSGVDSIRAVQEGDRVKAWGEQCALYGKTVEQAIETALAVWGRERK